MFKKPIRVKTSNRMKGSERKRLKHKILEQFPSLSDEKLSDITPNKEDLFITKLENANNIYITCYCVNKNPVFYEIDKEATLYPTGIMFNEEKRSTEKVADSPQANKDMVFHIIYALWLCTDLVPYMVTSSIVFEKICRGADLMLPGVIMEYGGFDNLVKGQVVAVKIIGNSAPVAVGVSTMSSQEMFDCGMKGKGVIINHWYMDHLWALGDSLEIPHIVDEVLLDKNEADKAEAEVAAEDDTQKFEVGKDTLKDGAGIRDVADRCAASKEGDKDDSLLEGDDGEKASDDTDGATSKEEASDMEKETTFTVEEQMAQLLENCFNQAVLDAKKVDLPILVTKFSAQYLHPACPAGQKIDVKKSRYKKMSKFLQEMESKGLIKLAELSKGVLSFTAFNTDHECLRDFKASAFARESKAAREERKSKESENQVKENPGIAVIEMFAVSGKTQAFFRQLGKSKGDAMTAPDIRQLLTTYVKDNELVSPTDKRKIILDPLLSDVLFDKEFNQEAVTWDVLFARFTDKMNPCHKTILGGKESKIKKGKIEPIEVKVQQRMGNKKVTLVQKLEQFGIDPNEFAHQIQLSAASSTTVSYGLDKGSSSQQVLIQGSQILHVAKLLDELKVPKKYITGLDKAKSTGKKR